MNIAWLIIVTLLIIIGQSYLYRKWGLSRIIYTRSFSHAAVFEGEEIEMIDEITNKKILPIPWVRLESKIDIHLHFDQSEEGSDIQSEAFHRTLFSLMPYQKITRRHPILCTRRGYYRLENVSLTTGDAFGLTESNQMVNGAAEVLVYPQFLKMNEIPLPSHSYLGDIIAKRWIMDDPFLNSGVREYTPRDPINQIHWKATARTGTLQVRKTEFTSDHHLLILLNFDQSPDHWMPILDETLIEKGIAYAATLAQEAILNGVSTGFGCNSYLVDQYEKIDRIKESVRIEPLGGGQALNYLLEIMAKLAVDRSKSFNQFLKEEIENTRENTDILIITSLLTEQMEEYIKKLKENGNAVEILWVKHENDREDNFAEEGEAIVG